MASSKAWKSTWGTIDWKHDPQEIVLQKVEQLLASGADRHINTRNIYGETVLVRSANMGYESVVERLLAVPDIDVNAKNIYKNNGFKRKSINKSQFKKRKICCRDNIR